MMNANIVRTLISEAIESRAILFIKYRHTSDGEVVDHKIAPFDIGTTNPKTQERNRDNVYAYSYTHLDSKTNLPNPKVCAFNIDSFVDIQDAGEKFDENELARLNQIATKYDYRTCAFNVAKNRGWFR
ncbi:hypothetical protein C0431_15620 [bacterium]|nr:hypothetical protein [bacterium]